jgi:hypothetical protein
MGRDGAGDGRVVELILRHLKRGAGITRLGVDVVALVSFHGGLHLGAHVLGAAATRLLGRGAGRTR